MANNIFSYKPNLMTAIANATFSSIGFDNSNNITIVYEVDATIKSYNPSRTINSLSSITSGMSYYIIAKVDMDVSSIFSPPITNPLLPQDFGFITNNL